MNDTVLRVAATLYGEAGMTLAMLYAAAYVMACRMDSLYVYDGLWVDMLAGTSYTGHFNELGGWAWYKRAVARGTLYLEDMREAIEEDGGLAVSAHRLAWLMVRGKFGPAQIAALAEYDTGLQLAGPLLFCMSEEDRHRKDGTVWPEGDVIVDGPKGYELHLYREWPGR